MLCVYTYQYTITLLHVLINIYIFYTESLLIYYVSNRSEYIKICIYNNRLLDDASSIPVAFVFCIFVHLRRHFQVHVAMLDESRRDVQLSIVEYRDVSPLWRRWDALYLLTGGRRAHRALTMSFFVVGYIRQTNGVLHLIRPEFLTQVGKIVHFQEFLRLLPGWWQKSKTMQASPIFFWMWGSQTNK